jgi:hypothetical protein
MSSSQFPGAYGSVHALAGLHMWPTAHLFYPRRSEFPPGVENLLDLTLLVSRFPNPVPPGTYVPHWAILDVTVCLKFFFKQHHNNNTLQNENYWNADESYAAGSEHHLSYVLFPPVVTVSHQRFI